jgi:hypothetical protein
MKNTSVKPGKKAVTAKPKHTRPENKDDLDSRQNEEQDFKAGDVTHNTKYTKSKKIKHPH